MKILVLICIFLLAMHSGYSQCDQIGQSPLHAYPICGYGTTTQIKRPSCGARQIYFKDVCVPHMNTFANNAFFYKFTCYKSGYFLFMLNCGSSENYNWMLYDVTNIPVNEIFQHQEVIVAGNFSKIPGNTGMSGQGTTSPFVPCITNDPIQEGGPISFWRDLYEGHNYILMVCNDLLYSNPYKLTFDYGSTAVITDPVLPHLKTTDAPCDGTLTSIKINKQIKCTSIAADGSDFEISPKLANVIAARGIGCNQDFDTDSIHITLDAP
ncbi:MAG: hypothetical protein ABIP30_03530, partial [Ferruginibacter sp.]